MKSANGWRGIRPGSHRAHSIAPATPSNLLASSIALSALDEHGIAEFVSSIVVGFELFIHENQSGVVGEGAEQLIMAGTGLVGSREYGVDNAQAAGGPDPAGRQSLAGSYPARVLLRLVPRR